jgi:hypothetical protein
MSETAMQYARIHDAHKRSALLCAHCRWREAVCVGMYDGMEEPEPAGGECCAHGCEDGHCEPLGGGDDAG